MPLQFVRAKRLSLNVTILPVSQVALAGCEDSSQRWRALGDRPRLALSLPSTPIPSGWVLLQGRLLRKFGSWVAFLHAETADPSDGLFSMELPVSRKGTINELVELPQNVSRLLLEPMQGEGEFELGEFIIKPVGKIERIHRMYKRIFGIYSQKPRPLRKRAGLHTRTALFRVRDAYRISGRLRTFTPCMKYDRWIHRFDVLSPADISAIYKDIRKIEKTPSFCFVFLPGGNSSCDTTIKSLSKQFFSNYAIDTHCNYKINNTLNAKNWFIPIQSGTTLAPHAIYWMAKSVANNPKLRFIYADHDYIKSDGQRYDPIFKPDWSPELLRSTNYIGQTAAIRGDILARIEDDFFYESDLHALWLRAGEIIPRYAIGHIHAPLFHLPPKTHGDGPTRTNPDAVAGHLQRLGVPASVTPTPRGHCRVRYALPKKPPLVSVIIPTRDCLPVLQACVQSVLEKTNYHPFEIIIVDNLSVEPQTLAYLQSLTSHRHVRVLRWDSPFNYSAINNFAVRHSQGETLCLLNNDTEVIGPNWLEEMVSHLVQPGIGVVGAKLYYTNGNIQHAGDAVGPGGCADHMHSNLCGEDTGYCDRAVLAQDLSAVTAACMLTWKHIYKRVGGFDAVNLPVAFNDVDYCLKVRRIGLRVVWTPYANLYHHESYSRAIDITSKIGIEQSQSEVKYMRKRWKKALLHDPYYNPNLSYARPDFSLNVSPLVKRPWES